MICVYGATGRTGRLVASALTKLGLRVRMAGRTHERLVAASRQVAPSATVAVAPVEDGDALDRALSRCHVVVNCAGPFGATSELIDAAIRSGVHYLDVSGEGAHAHATHREWHGPALTAGVAVVPAIGAIGAIGDWGAHLSARALEATPARFDVTYVHSGAQFLALSDGTVESAASQNVTHGDEVVRHVHLPPPFGSGYGVRIWGPEEASIPRCFEGTSTRTFYALDPGGPFNGLLLAALKLSRPQLRALSQALAAPAVRLPRRGLHALSTALGKSTESAVLVETASATRKIDLAIMGADAYEITAHIVALVVSAIARRAPPHGVLTPSELIDPAWALYRLRDAGRLTLRWRRHGWS